MILDLSAEGTATLAVAGARAAGGWTAGASVLSAARKGITLLLSTSAKKVGSLVAVAALRRSNVSTSRENSPRAND